MFIIVEHVCAPMCFQYIYVSTPTHIKSGYIGILPGRLLKARSSLRGLKVMVRIFKRGSIKIPKRAVQFCRVPTLFLP